MGEVLLPYVAIGHLAAGFVGGLLTFATLSTWIWRHAFRNAHMRLARKLIARDEIARGLHVGASLALFESEWEREDNEGRGE